MKILMVSIPSLHFFRWTSQLQDSGHEVYWFDITGASNHVERINWVSQKINWKMRWDFPGRIALKTKFPQIYQKIQKLNEKDTAKIFEEYLLEIKPDVVHSFALYLSCTPIISVMEKYSHQKWIYSSWGSDLFYYQNDPLYLKDIQRVLPRVNFLFTDCKRDYEIAKRNGFTGNFLGVFPGGGGFDLAEINTFKAPLNERNIVLIKGFQGRSGRAISVLQAVELLKEEFSSFQIVIFGADAQVFEYAKKSSLQHWDNFEIKGKVSHLDVIKLMGQSLIYIGNSNSDGIPNTLLEAICMEVFPIQSNPGGATAEIITNENNGALIEDCEDVDGISRIIKDVLEKAKLKKLNHNQSELISALDFNQVKKEIIQKYKLNEFN